ncbi:Imm2 family immunity protein [Pectobacterium brasiliense]|uniref:Imm2 family immunity protein n=1 Tax=Pectobacterium brasiliense TaxID=180957 RepID=UPI003016A854
MNSYDEIKNIFFNACYSYCQNKSLVSKENGKKWSENESEHAFAYDALEGSFNSPTEDLMLEVITLISDAGRETEQTKKYHQDVISTILSKHSLNELLDDVTDDDRKDLLYDMSLLGLIDKQP